MFLSYVNGSDFSITLHIIILSIEGKKARKKEEEQTYNHDYPMIHDHAYEEDLHLWLEFVLSLDLLLSPGPILLAQDPGCLQSTPTLC